MTQQEIVDHWRKGASQSLRLAELAHRSAEQKQILNDLTDYAVAARYDDPGWAEKQATEQNSALWLATTKDFLTAFL